ncbi:ATP-binding protein [Saccharothrix coeruleofusca]|uniref:Histidine kinase/HSP90-like ATPase domain-containing protein n=1 Tax=Saccharothrix coeruleofusca TaxID=33919 RepID=A0A918AWS5_9PSEU|nr:ATP-binding protein [Saccharothrix coeruleofusca]MBP2335658.1 anti-sigma regulatory factor (Ser/Thr protein kinase) [Saccharothrix coeruleofusca]GGP86525.1 hypothetical protein GCM10010185_70340 [Saccharothrix coeruleofusca]
MSTVDLPRDDAVLELPDEPLSRADLERRIASAVPGVRGDRLADVLTVAAELARNACLHANSPRRMRLNRPREGVVRIEVVDGSPGVLPVLGRFDQSWHGRGLVVVNRLAEHWGCQPHGDHKVVWAEVRHG